MTDIIYVNTVPENFTNIWNEKKHYDADIAYIKISLIKEWFEDTNLIDMTWQEAMKAERELVKIIGEKEWLKE